MAIKIIFEAHEGNYQPWTSRLWDEDEDLMVLGSGDTEEEARNDALTSRRNQGCIDFIFSQTWQVDRLVQ